MTNTYYLSVCDQQLQWELYHRIGIPKFTGVARDAWQHLLTKDKVGMYHSGQQSQSSHQGSLVH